MTNVHLLVHNVIGIGSVLVFVALALLILLNDHKKALNITLVGAMASAIVFLISHVIGTSVADPLLSRSILMWNLSVVMISVFCFHAVMIALHREKERQWVIVFAYFIGISFIAFFIAFPDTFILASAPKLYFPNYYVPGTLHWLYRAIFQGALPAYFVYELARAYRRTQDVMERNRYLYFSVGLGSAWALGIVPLFLIWDIPVDPVYGLFFPICFGIPFTYAVLKYELLDIRIVARTAFVYGVLIATVGILISLFNSSNQWIQAAYPSFPFWVMPLISSVILVGIGVAVWKQLRQDDILKYEFITTVTHKFRTPLTHIKWASENIRHPGLSAEDAEQLGYIQEANTKLVELTDLLANVSEADENLYHYHMDRGNLSAFVDEATSSSSDYAAAKKIIIIRKIAPEVYASFDAAKLKFVMQTFVENAVSYTPAGGTITVSVRTQGRNAVCSVADSGIGIPKNEQQLMFTKLYRGKRARSIDTEGMGIGLYVSKGIITRHRGKIWVESEGENKGAAFSFSLPAVK